MITGLTANSKKNFVLDAGAIYKSWVMGTDDPATSTTKAKLIGATEGGATIALSPEIRQIQVDGAKSPTKGLEVIDGWTCTLNATIKEVTPNAIKMALGAATVSTTAMTGYSKIEPSVELTDADYIDNVAWVGKQLGSISPMVIILKNALSLNGWSLQAQDKGEGSVPVTLTAHVSADAPDSMPVEIYAPTIA